MDEKDKAWLDKWLGSISIVLLVIAFQLLLVLLCMGASAATLTMAFDRPVYAVGDTITLSIVGDAQGASAYGVFGRLMYDGDVVDLLSVESSAFQTQTAPWILGVNRVDETAGEVDVWNQIAGLEARVPDAPATATVTFRATSADKPLWVGWNFNHDPGDELDFFGLEPWPNLASLRATVPIGSLGAVPVPEPSGALLMAVGLVLLVARHQIRHAS